MSVLELLSHKLTVQPAGLLSGGGGGVRALEAGEVAAMLAGLEPGPVALAYCKFVEGEAKAADWRRLGVLLHLTASDMSRAQGWDDVPRGSCRVETLAHVVREDLVFARERTSERAGAQRLGVSRWKWRTVWQYRYAGVLAVGVDWEWQVVERLRRELRG